MTLVSVGEYGASGTRAAKSDVCVGVGVGVGVGVTAGVPAGVTAGVTAGVVLTISSFETF